MKTEMQIASKFGFVLITLFLVGVLTTFLFFRKSYLNHNKDMTVLVGKELKGRISDLKNQNRGSYYVEIKNDKIRSLPIAFEVEKYNIQVGDSISKEAKSNIMTFYKNKNGTFIKCFDFEIRM